MEMAVEGGRDGDGGGRGRGVENGIERDLV